jgi:hypothetical protein
VIFDRLFNLCTMALSAAAPFLGLLIHHGQRCGDSGNPTVETRIAIAVSCLVSLSATVGITLYWAHIWNTSEPYTAWILPVFTVPIMAATCLLAWIAARITNKMRHRTKQVHPIAGKPGSG